MLVYSCFLVISPKVIVISWLIATFQWWSLLFFGPVMILLREINLATRGKMDNANSRKCKTDRSSKPFFKGIHTIQRKSAVDTFHDMFGIRKNMKSSAIILLLSSVFVIVMLTCTLPQPYNPNSISFDPSSKESFYIRNPEPPEKYCVCQNLTLKVTGEENGWSQQYFENNIVCKKDTLPVDTPVQNKTAKCYDPTFFQIPYYFSAIPVQAFPAVSTCFTFDQIQKFLKIDQTYDKQSYQELFIPLQFDNRCLNQTVIERFRPCTNHSVTTIKVVFAIMITWMCFGLFAMESIHHACHA